MARTRHGAAVIAGARFAVFEERADDDVERVAFGGGMRLDGALEVRPDPAVETVLPLRRLVGVVECLVVGIAAGLAVFGSAVVAAGIAVAVVVVRGRTARLPGARDGRIVAGTFREISASDRVVGVGSRMHRVCRPKRAALGLVDHRGVVAVDFAVVLVSVGYDLAGRGACVVLVPTGTAEGLGAGGGVGGGIAQRYRRNLVALEVLGERHGGSGERALLAVTVLVRRGALVVFYCVRLVVVGRGGCEAGESLAERTGRACGSDLGRKAARSGSVIETDFADSPCFPREGARQGCPCRADLTRGSGGYCRCGLFAPGASAGCSSIFTR